MKFNLRKNFARMEMKSNGINDIATRFQAQVEMEKEVGAMVVEEYRDGCDDDLRKNEEKFKENNGNIGIDHHIVNDDVCPICLDRFTIPCRSNCGHFFCAACILQLWMYRYNSIQACKCPLCCCRIVNMQLLQTFDPSNNDHVRNQVQHYNGLYISGLIGIAPLLMGRMFRVIVDLDCLRCIYYVVRIIGLFLGLLYERLEFEFVPTGGLGIHRMFDLIASLLVAALFLVGVVYRWMLKPRRSRLLAVIDS